MEGRGDPQTLGPQAPALQLGLHRCDRCGLTTDHDLIGRVVVRDHDRHAEVGEDGAHLLDVGLHRGHRAVGLGRGLHQLAALAGDAQHVLRGERPGCVQCSDLAEAVAGDRRGVEAQAPHQTEHRRARGADGRLRPAGGAEQILVSLGVGVGEPGRRVDDAVEPLAVFEPDVGRCVPRGARDVEGHGELGTHAEVLAPLPWEQERDVALHGAEPEAHAVGSLERLGRRLAQPAGSAVELGEQVVDRGRDHRQAGRC